MLAAAQHRRQFLSLGLAQFDPVPYIHRSPPCRRRRTNRSMSQKSGAHFTDKQGHYLAFIYPYTRIFGRPPAEADMQRHFAVSPPSVHQMIITLERNGLIRRQADSPQKHRNPRAARKLPDPKRARYQTVKIPVTSH